MLRLSGICKVEAGEKNMSELTSMMNIGKEMAKKLSAVGIDSSEKLIETGNPVGISLLFYGRNATIVYNLLTV